MAEHADEVGRSQDLGSRLPAVSSRDAVGRLTTSFNAMMDRLQGAYARVETALAAQQRFTADASHELRTPLTTVRNNAEFLLAHPDARPADREAALRDIAGESVRMSRLIDNLLTLARADGGVRLHRELVNLAELAESVCRQAAAQHADREISFAGTPAPPVAGDDDSLRQLLWILLDNAVKFCAVVPTSAAGSRDGGGRGAGRAIWVAVTQRAERVQLTVADDGIGLPAGRRSRIFERFHRADPARSGAGAGLGLAIAAWIVPQHQGAIVAANNDRGGATFSVDLPVAPGPDEETVQFAAHPTGRGAPDTAGARLIGVSERMRRAGSVPFGYARSSRGCGDDRARPACGGRELGGPPANQHRRQRSRTRSRRRGPSRRTAAATPRPPHRRQ